MTTRRVALGLALILAAIPLVPVPAATAETARTVRGPGAGGRQPNVLFVLTDDMTLGDLKAMPRTAHLVADHGVTFDRFFVNDPACCPSRATILTGRAAHNTGVFSNGGDNGGFETAHRVGLERDTVATRLHRAGYRTGLFGKYLNGFPNGVPPDSRPPGWSTFVTPVAGDPYAEYGYVVAVDGRLVLHGRRPSDYGTTVYADAAAQFVRAAARDRRPFFAALTVYAPHQPAVPAPRDARAFAHARAPRTPSFNQADVSRAPAYVRGLPRLDRRSKAFIDELYRRRLQSLQAVDRQVARLVRVLRRAGTLDDTYIVFASDNGFHLGQHRLPAGKYTPYETDIHVPLLVRGPGIPAGAHVAALTGNIDLAPTFEAMAGVARPRTNDGRSLLRLARDPSTASDWPRRAYLVEHRRETGRTQPARNADLPLEPPDPESDAATESPGLPVMREPTYRSHDYARLRRVGGVPDYDAVRTARWLYVEYVTGERELYDLRHDPDETVNLASHGKLSVERALARRLAALRTCAGPTCRAADRAPPLAAGPPAA